MEINNQFFDWLYGVGITGGSAVWIMRVSAILALVILAFIIEKLSKKLVLPIVRKLTGKTKSSLDDYLLSDDVVMNLSRIIAPVLINIVVSILFTDVAEMTGFIGKCCSIYLVIVIVLLACSVISSIYAISSEKVGAKNLSLKGFYQMLKLVVWCIGAIIIISTLLDKNPTVILTGLGAGTAILMLVFQDTIKGLVAGIQLMANDMLRPGDWITVPKYGADGDVLEVTLTTVKVQNWDKTITTVPPYALINDSFQNWRGMFDIGGRRVKRSINIDMNTVRFCTNEELERFKSEPWMEGFEATGDKEVNLYIFRHYMEYYLTHHPKVSKELIMIVRQLQPTQHGIPVELYFFSADTRWIKYEQLQAEVFDHVLAMMHIFDLRVYQSPSGLDFQNIN